MDNEKIPQNYIFIINPVAGKRHYREMARRIESVFDQQEDKLGVIVFTEMEGHATRLAAEFAEQYGPDAVIFACGGDGTAGEVANGLANTDAVMGLIPMGTANDFYHTVTGGLPLDEFLPRLPFPEIRRIDAIDVDGKVCLNIMSLGLDTMVQIKASYLIRKLHFPAGLAYPPSVALALLGNRMFKMHYEMEGVSEAGQSDSVSGDSNFILAAVCNGRYYGGGFNPAPSASLDDGLLDICLVDSLPLARILPLIPRYKKGMHLGDPAIKYFQASSGRITALAEPLPGNMDGEVFSRNEINFAVMPGALRFAFY